MLPCKDFLFFTKWPWFDHESLCDNSFYCVQLSSKIFFHKSLTLFLMIPCAPFHFCLCHFIKLWSDSYICWSLDLGPFLVLHQNFPQRLLELDFHKFRWSWVSVLSIPSLGACFVFSLTSSFHMMNDPHYKCKALKILQYRSFAPFCEGCPFFPLRIISTHVDCAMTWYLSMTFPLGISCLFPCIVV